MTLRDGAFLLLQHLFVAVGESKSTYKTCVMLYYYIAFEAEKSSPQQMGNDVRIYNLHANLIWLFLWLCFLIPSAISSLPTVFFHGTSAWLSAHFLNSFSVFCLLLWLLCITSCIFQNLFWRVIELFLRVLMLSVLASNSYKNRNEHIFRASL